ncbi:WGR domain containing protein [Aphelenchoides avenae]|nr:WGR domain containing protein [Aphelenchus avenae]
MPAELDRQYKKQPYCTEYARTGASHCRDCKGAISEGALRMGTRFPSRKHEGMQESWFHFNCFWRKPRKTISESRIYGFERLDKTDQNRIRSHLSGKERFSSEDLVAPGTVDEQDRPLPKGVRKRRGGYRRVEGAPAPKKAKAKKPAGAAVAKKSAKGKGGRSAATTSGVNKRRPRGKAAGAK